MSLKPVDTKKVLNYILSKRKNNENTLELNIGEAINDLKISREELNQAIFVLESEGYLRILKIPPSKILIDEIKSKFMRLDGLLLLGEISRDEYNKRYEEALSVLARVPEELKNFSLIPVESIEEFVVNMHGLISSLERLKEYSEETKPEVLEDLRKRYNEIVMEQLSLLSRILKSLSLITTNEINALKKEERELEVLEVDEKIRGVDLSAEKKKKRENINKAENRLKRIYQIMVLEEEQTNDITSKKLQEIEEKIKSLKTRLDILNAKILIEGEKPDLLNLKKSLENERQNLELEMEKIKHEKSFAVRKLAPLLKNIEKLKEDADLLNKENRELILSILKDFGEIHENLLKLDKNLRV